MHSRVVLNDKYTVARLPDICSPRSKLMAQFARNGDKRVILVAAPTGYSKTVSTALWLAQSKCQSIWVSLDAYDNMLSLFYTLIATGVASLQPDNQAMQAWIRSPLFSTTPIEHTIGLMSAFIPDEVRYALVLEDMHTITDEEILKSLPYVVKRLPPQFILVILTRNSHMEGFEFYWSQGKMAQFTGKDLAFSEQEILAFYIAHQCPITAQVAADIKRLTDGWPIAVNALVQSGHTAYGNAVGLPLEGYIRQTIWDSWDEGIRHFMMQTAIPDELTVPLCIVLTQREDCQALLDELCRKNAFIIQMGNKTYRYHTLFLAFLRKMADQSGMDLKPLYQQTAQYYVDADDYLTASRYARQSGDMELITKVLYTYSHYTSLPLNEYISFAKIFDKDILTEAICSMLPFLYISLAFMAYLCGRPGEMTQYLDKIYQALPTIIAHFPVYIETVKLVMGIDHRIPLPQLGQHLKPLMIEGSDVDIRPNLTYTVHLPFFHRASRDHAFLADEAVMDNQWTPMTEMYKQAPVIERIRPCYVSAIALEKNQLSKALAFALEANENIPALIEMENVFSVRMHLAAVYHAMDDQAAFKAILRVIEDQIDSQAMYLRFNFQAFKAICQITAGNQSAAKAWLDNYYVVETDKLAFYKVYQYFATARAYIAMGKSAEAVTLLVKLKQMAIDYVRPLDIAEVGVLQAIVDWATGRKEEAQVTLEGVLADMQPYGFVRIIAAEGSAVLPILKKITTMVDSQGYQGPLQPSYVREVSLAAHQQAKQYKGLSAFLSTKTNLLTKQQRHILLLLEKGHTYKEIMGITGLTIHTVKAHATTAYAKLGVNNSLDAIIRARELGYID